MADCEKLKGCPYFNGFIEIHMPSVAAELKEKFCKGDSSNCARFMVSKALGPDAVPNDLGPEQIILAQKLIAAKS
jgi:hypothetical protein